MMSAVWQVSFHFPKATDAMKAKMIQAWCKKLLDILEVSLSFPVNNFTSGSGILFVSNHISWLDIIVINAAMPMRFLAKSEVKDWPLFGYLANKLNTVYVQRENRSDARKAVENLIDVLNEGQRICIFPEGTSSDGLSILKFKSNLFESVIASDAICIPLALTYKDVTSLEISTAPAYWGEISLIESIKNIVNASPMMATISIGAVIDDCETRKAMSLNAWEQIDQMR